MTTLERRGLPRTLAPDSWLRGSSPALVATTVPARKGQPLSFSFGGIPNPTQFDWVAIYTPGTSDYNYLAGRT